MSDAKSARIKVNQLEQALDSEPEVVPQLKALIQRISESSESSESSETAPDVC